MLKCLTLSSYNLCCNMRKIVIPTDFSENAMNAIKYALELFKYEKSEVYFLHAYGDEVYKELKNREMFADVLNDKKNYSEQKLEDILKIVNEIYPNPNHKYYKVAAFNSLIDEIDKITDEKNIDIIVMGTKGKTNDAKLTFGSNAMQVLRYVKCPVLLVPEKYTDAKPKKIVFSTDYMIQYNKRELKLLSQFVNQYRAAIDLLCISKVNELSLRQEHNKIFIEDALKENDLNFITINEKNIPLAITTYIKDSNADMLVMVNTRHSYLENILVSSTIDKVGLNIKIPFLAMQNVNRV